MIRWRIIRQFPKFAIAFVVVLVSTGLFGLWWMLNRSEPAQQAAVVEEIRKVEVQKKAELLPERIGSLALVGTDLYDIETGEVVFPNWLGGLPRKIYYHEGSNKLIVLGERGVARFNMDGSDAGVMAAESLPAYTQDAKQAAYVKNGDIWRADVDWQEFKLVSERQVTHYGQFLPHPFAANVAMITSKALLVRNMNQLLWVNLETGEFKPVQVPLTAINKRRSPNGRYLLGEDTKGFYRYDVESNGREDLPKSWDNRIVDCQWLGDDRCALLAIREPVQIFDNRTGQAKAVAQPPAGNFTEVLGASPTGRFVICTSMSDRQILDTETGKLEEFGMPARDFLWVGDDRLICSCEVADSEKRGTWIKTVGTPWLRILPDPYLAGRETRAAVLMASGDAILGTKDSLIRVESDGTNSAQFVVDLKRSPVHIQAIEDWAKLEK